MSRYIRKNAHKIMVGNLAELEESLQVLLWRQGGTHYRLVPQADRLLNGLQPRGHLAAEQAQGIQPGQYIGGVHATDQLWKTAGGDDLAERPDDGISDSLGQPGRIYRRVLE